MLQAQLEATRPRYEVGELTRTDVAQAEARLQGAVAARIQAVGQLTASRAIYREVIGEEPVDAKMPTERLQLPSSCEESVALSRRAPEVQAAVLRERAAKDDIDVQFQRDAADGRDRRQLSTPA